MLKRELRCNHRIRAFTTKAMSPKIIIKMVVLTQREELTIWSMSIPVGRRSRICEAW